VIATTLTIVLLINSLILIILILNQNESAKDSASNAINTEIPNPLQNLTWLCVFLEFILLLVKSKITEF
jgi:preprotein translocase subunit SecG